MLFSIQHLATSCNKSVLLQQIEDFCNKNLCVLQNNSGSMCLYISKLWKLLRLLRLLRLKMCLTRERFFFVFFISSLAIRNTNMVSYCWFMNKMKIFFTHHLSLYCVRACICSKKIKKKYLFARLCAVFFFFLYICTTTWAHTYMYTRLCSTKDL